MLRPCLFHRIIFSTRQNVRGSRYHCARLAYLLHRIHHGPRAARYLMHWSLVKLWPKRALWRYITLPYLKAFHPQELARIVERVRSVTRV